MKKAPAKASAYVINILFNSLKVYNHSAFAIIPIINNQNKIIGIE